MRSARYSTSRQKACRQCATSKIKCDRKAGTCSPCQKRGLACTYVQSRASLPSGPDATGTCDGAESGVTLGSAFPGITVESANVPSQRAQQMALHGPGFAEALGFPPNPERLGTAAVDVPSTPGTCQVPVHRQGQPAVNSGGIPAASSPAPPRADELDFARLELTCPINADDIANRWLNSFVPLPGQQTKDYTPRISAFIHRILKSYANSAIRGHKVPPFVHWSQLSLQSSAPLSTCVSVLRRVCNESAIGGAEASSETLQDEMAKLFDQHPAVDDMALLATFQAHLIYSLVVFFRTGRGGHYPFLSQAMMNTQELACAAARKGLVCAADEEHTRPTWESWIVAEAKRRTLFTMCLFDSALLSHDGLPTHLATELRGLPAPASKSLWESRNRRDWQTKYDDLHLAEWPDGGLRIDELWPMPEDLGKDGVEERRRRVDAWLEDLDEFGTAIYAVTSGTHGT